MPGACSFLPNLASAPHFESLRSDPPNLASIARMERTKQPIVILGAGYTGKFLYRLARKQGETVFATSRWPENHLSFTRPEDRLAFDLNRKETWESLPPQSQLIWCFPALPAKAASAFARHMTSQKCRFLVLGTTSAFPRLGGGIIDETMEVDLAKPRTQSEEDLRKTHGAIVLRLAGLYGPGRNVLDWIRKGKIFSSERYVNLIHVEDVAGICLKALTHAPPGSAYIVSDGVPRRWSEICTMAVRRWGIPRPPHSHGKDGGKQLSSCKVLRELNYQLRYPDLYEALDILEQDPRGTHS